MDFMHILGQKEAIWNTILLFLSDGGPLSMGLQMIHKYNIGYTTKTAKIITNWVTYKQL